MSQPAWLLRGGWGLQTNFRALRASWTIWCSKIILHYLRLTLRLRTEDLGIRNRIMKTKNFETYKNCIFPTFKHTAEFQNFLQSLEFFLQESVENSTLHTWFCHVDCQVIVANLFVQIVFLAPSRFGRGIAMGVLKDLGYHVENIWRAAHSRCVTASQNGVQYNNSTLVLVKIRLVRLI